jgi:hypothetical protein
MRTATARLIDLFLSLKKRERKRVREAKRETKIKPYKDK